MEDAVIFSQGELRRLLVSVDETIERAVTAGNPLIATDAANSLIQEGHMKGLALARLFWGIRNKWNLFQAAGIEEDFVTFMSVHTGRSRQTVSKYANMWDAVFANESISEELKEELTRQNMSSLMLLTAAVKEGMPEESIKKAANATSDQEIRDIVRQQRGDATSSKTAIRIYFQQIPGQSVPAGSLFIRENGIPVIFGTLDLDVGNVNAEKAINRILNAAHVVEVV